MKDFFSSSLGESDQEAHAAKTVRIFKRNNKK